MESRILQKKLGRLNNYEKWVGNTLNSCLTYGIILLITYGLSQLFK